MSLRREMICTRGARRLARALACARTAATLKGSPYKPLTPTLRAQTTDAGAAGRGQRGRRRAGSHPQPARQLARIARRRALLQRRARLEPGQHQVGGEERDLGARRHRHRSRVDRRRPPADRGLLSLAQRPQGRPAQADDHHRGPADDAVGAAVDEQPLLRRVGAERRTGCSTRSIDRCWPSRAPTWITAPAARTCCRRSSRRPPGRARGSTRRKCSPSRSASRSPSGRAIRRASISAATTC